MDWFEAQIADVPASGGRSGPSRWVGLCLCGHTEEYHGMDTMAKRPVGVPGAADQEILGCRGATPNRNDPGPRWDGERRVWVFEATCPCRLYRHVADVDRPGRLFRQKTWTKDDGAGAHPMAVGMKALLTRMTNAKTIRDPQAEVAARFKKVEGRWRCRICKAEDESVRPMYTSDGRHSQMRCKNHTRERTPSLYGPQQDVFCYEWKSVRKSGRAAIE